MATAYKNKSCLFLFRAQVFALVLFNLKFFEIFGIIFIEKVGRVDMRFCKDCEHLMMCQFKGEYAGKKACAYWQGWIKCEDELPSEDDEEVLIAIRMASGDVGIERSYYESDRGFYRCDSGFKVSPKYVIAWRPLPLYYNKELGYLEDTNG